MFDETRSERSSTPGTTPAAKSSGARVYDRPSRVGKKSTLMLLALILIVATLLLFIL